MTSVDIVGSLGRDLNRNGGSDSKKTAEPDLSFQRNLKQVIEADERNSRIARPPSKTATHTSSQKEKDGKTLHSDRSELAHARLARPNNHAVFENVGKGTNSQASALDDESHSARLANESEGGRGNEAGEANVCGRPVLEDTVASVDRALELVLDPAHCQLSKTPVIAVDLISTNYPLRRESPEDPMRARGPMAEPASDTVAQDLPDMPQTPVAYSASTGMSILEAQAQKIQGFMTTIQIDGAEQTASSVQTGGDAPNPAFMTRPVHRLTMTVGSISDGYVKCDIRKMGEILDIVMDASVGEYDFIRGRESDLKRSLEDIGVAVDNVKVQFSPRSEREADFFRRGLEHGSYGGDREAGRRQNECNPDDVKPSKGININAKNAIEGIRLPGGGAIYI
jgi:hypothetical protein